MGLSVLNPWLLILLGLAPAAAWLGLKGRTGLSRRRRVVSSSIRAAVLVLLVLALAELHWVRTSDQLAVLFVVDLSKSVPPEFRGRIPAWIQEAAKGMTERDRAGVVVFGRDAMIEEPATTPLKLAGFTADVRKDQTDVAAALRLAMAAFPEGSRKRIVLMTDGNENRGSAAEEAAAAKAAEVQIDVVPFRYDYPREVLVESFAVPADAKVNEPFEARVVVNATHAGPAALRVSRNRELQGELKVDLKPGKNVFPLTLKIPPGAHGLDPKFNAFEAVIEPEGDTLTENNRAHAFTVVQGRHAVLLVGAEPRDVEFIARAMEQEGILHVTGAVGEVPLSMADLQNFDCLVLANVPASSLSNEQMGAVREAVRGTGMGLIMVGGENAFGAGGYSGTPVEEALPVEMDLKHKKVMPNGALCLILHTCEIPQGNYWAGEIGVAAIRALSAQDYAGVLYYGGGGGQWGEQWLFPLQRAVNKNAMINQIRNMQNGDMPTFDATLKLAHQGLKSVTAALKHIVIISDGDPSPPPDSLLKSVTADNITISTVAIGWHGGQDQGAMRRVATVGRGRYYEVADPGALPQIFLKEATTIRKAAVVEETFKPRARFYTEVIKGIDPGSIPALHGYVPTTKKDLAEAPVLAAREDDPILAHWQYGLGRSLAFTSDAKNRWGKDWTAWDRFSKFWAQAVRWCTRMAPKGNLHVTTATDAGGKGRVMVEAVDADGRFLNFLSLQGTVTEPDAEGQVLRFHQTAPGRYEAPFRADKIGSYLIGVGAEAPKEGGKAADFGTRTTGMAVSFAPEFRDLKTNEPLLRQIAETTGGRMIDAARDGADVLFRRDLPPTKTRTPLWPALLLLAACLFPFDVAARKLDVGRRELAEIRDAAAARMPLLRRLLSPRVKEKADPTMAALQAKIRSLRERGHGAGPAGGRAAGPARTEPPAAPPASRRFEAAEGAPTASLDALSSGAPAAPPKPAAPPPPPKPAADEGATYTQRLLDAKKRAKEKKQE